MYMEVGNTYVVQKICPVCGQKAPVTKVRSRLITLKTDSDFCVHYKDFNPYIIPYGSVKTAVMPPMRSIFWRRCRSERKKSSLIF